MEQTKTFYEVAVSVWDGSHFGDSDSSTYYADSLKAQGAFDGAMNELYSAFEDAGYDSAEILVTVEDFIGGSRVGTITATNAADESDTCKVRRRELQMVE